MSKRDDLFAALILAADRYVLAMADAPHGKDTERGMTRDVLIDLINNGRRARARDKALAVKRRQRRDEQVRSIVRNLLPQPRSLAEIYAEEEARRSP